LANRAPTEQETRKAGSFTNNFSVRQGRRTAMLSARLAAALPANGAPN
jgi:hypothetical protein